MRRDPTVASFRKGIEVLRSFGEDFQRQTVSEVAARTDMSRAAARRFLLTLCDIGFARTDGKTYELTPAVLSIGHAFLAGMSELEIVRSALVDLTHKLSATASAAMLEGAEVIYVVRLAAPQRHLHIGSAIGMRRPAHATAIGQVLLAGLPKRELDAYFATVKLVRRTPFTITNKSVLKTRLQEVRRNGYALINEENELGVRSVAVRITKSGTSLAISTSAYTAETSEEKLRAHVLPLLKEKARMISLAFA